MNKGVCLAQNLTYHMCECADPQIFIFNSDAKVIGAACSKKCAGEIMALTKDHGLRLVRHISEAPVALNSCEISEWLEKFEQDTFDKMLKHIN